MAFRYMLTVQNSISEMVVPHQQKTPTEYIFSPQRIDIDTIVINGRSGNISVDAIRWLVKHGVQVTVLNWDGKILTTMLPPESVQVKTKFAQYRAFENPKLRLIDSQENY